MTNWSPGEDVVPCRTATKHFNFPDKMRLLNMHVLAQTTKSSNNVSKNKIFQWPEGSVFIDSSKKGKAFFM